MENNNNGKIPTGRELDRWLHETLFGQPSSEEVPRYSSDSLNADRVRERLETMTRNPVVIQRCEKEGAHWFARAGKECSPTAEASAETRPLAICRLAVALV